jgi:putative ABC transport system permease protein
MDQLRHDLRHAFRSFHRNKGFTAVVVLTIALGIGANTAIFSAVNALLLRALPYEEPDELVTINHQYPSLDLEAPVSAYGFQRYRDLTRSFEAVSVHTGWAANFTGLSEPERLQAARVSADFFRVFGVEPVLGRTFLPEEDQPGNERVVVLSHGFWQRAFGGDPDIVGNTVTLNGEAHDIVGVMPSSFVDFWSRGTELWRPVALTTQQFSSGATNEFLALAARTRPGVSVEDAREEMRLFAERLKQETPDFYPPNWALTVTALDEVAKGDLRTPLLVLLGSVGFVLLIACANVANLLLARSMSRSKEVAIRAALGAGRSQLVRQLLTESVVLSLAGGLLGIALAALGLTGLRAAVGDQLPLGAELTVEAPVLAFAFSLAVMTGVFFGLIPALHSSRPALQETIREGSRTLSGDRAGVAARRGLVVVEVALALVLLAGAGLLIRSLARLQGVDPGFRPDGLVTFVVNLPDADYPSDPDRVAFFDEALEGIRAIPGVEAAGASSVLPFSGGWSTSSFTVEEYTPGDGQPGPWGDVRIATDGLTEALGVRLVAGRLFDTRDQATSPAVAVVDEEMARRFWPDEDPVGKRLTFDGPADDDVEWITVIGLVQHTKHAGLDDEDRVQLYLPHRQIPGVRSLSFAVRTTGEPMDAVPSIRRAIAAVDPQQPIAVVRTMDEMMSETLGQRRLAMLLLTLFSGLAGLLAALGIYGVISHLVVLRTKELGIRMALGAAGSNVVRLIVRQGMGLALGGILIGLLGAFALTRLMVSQLYEVRPTDPATFIAAAFVLSAVAFTSALLPAVRAARLDPVQALADE